MTQTKKTLFESAKDAFNPEIPYVKKPKVRLEEKPVSAADVTKALANMLKSLRQGF